MNLKLRLVQTLVVAMVWALVTVLYGKAWGQALYGGACFSLLYFALMIALDKIFPRKSTAKSDPTKQDQIITPAKAGFVMRLLTPHFYLLKWVRI